MGTPDDDPAARARRSSGLLRVPFVRRCILELEDGRPRPGFVVNINVLGAYVAWDDVGARSPARPAGEAAAGMPRVGEPVSCRFILPGSQVEIRLSGVASWVNVQQQHPVHSLPPGFGIRFEGLSEADRAHIEGVVSEYLERQGAASR